MKRSERQAVNSVIQGTAADVVKQAMIEVDKLIENHPYCKYTKLLLQVHDELVFEIEEQGLEPALALLANAMESVTKLDVDFPVKV
jgi:DNA polymerase I-like protein with 3'-5' exonuclease and polymerase domains